MKTKNKSRELKFSKNSVVKIGHNQTSLFVMAPTSELVHHFYKCVVDLFGIFPSPSDFCAVDTYLGRNYSALLLCRSDRIAKRYRQREAFVLSQYHHILHIYPSRICVLRQTCTFLCERISHKAKKKINEMCFLKLLADCDLHTKYGEIMVKCADAKDASRSWYIIICFCFARRRRRRHRRC